jgi:hypothetical protein
MSSLKREKKFFFTWKGEMGTAQDIPLLNPNYK